MLWRFIYVVMVKMVSDNAEVVCELHVDDAEEGDRYYVLFCITCVVMVSDNMCSCMLPAWSL